MFDLCNSTITTIITTENKNTFISISKNLYTDQKQ